MTAPSHFSWTQIRFRTCLKMVGRMDIVERFEKYRRLVLAVSCEVMGFLGLLTLLILSVDNTNYLDSFSHLFGFLSYHGLTFFFVLFLILFLAGLGLLMRLSFWGEKLSKFFKHFYIFYKDRVRSTKKDDH